MGENKNSSLTAGTTSEEIIGEVEIFGKTCDQLKCHDVQLPNMFGEKLKIPLRADGMLDLNDVNEFMHMNQLAKLKELLSLRKDTGLGTISRVMLNKAINQKKNEIALGFLTVLKNEDLSFQEAISLLELTEQKLKDSKFNL